MGTTGQQTYILNFKANVQGVDDVKKKFESILQMDGIQDKLTKSMQQAWASLQGKMSSYLKQMEEELSKSEPDLKILKILDKEFTTIINKANSFNSALQRITLPADVSAKISEITKKINAANSEITRLQNANLKAAEGLDKRTKTGFKKGSSAEAQAFASIESDVPEVGEIKNALSIAGGSWEDYKNKVEEAIKAGKLSNAQMQTAKVSIAAAETAMKNLASARSDEVEANNVQIDTQKDAIDKYEQEKTNILANANATNELTAAQQQLNAATQENAQNITGLAKQQQNTKSTLIDYIAQTNAGAAGTKQLTAAQNDNKKSTEGFGGTIAKATKQVLSYGTVVGLLRRAYSRTINTIKDMDKALTDMTVVTSLTRTEAWNMVGTFQDLATATGKTSAEIADITTKFLQQGKSISQALTLTEAAAKAATIAGISGEKSVDLLTNALNGFQMSASQAMEVSDKFAALAAASATDYEELATALSKVAAQANLAGMSMDFTLGLLAKGVETTREAPETIGTALKTVVSRMRELSDYGKTLEEGTDVNRVETALGNVGIELMDVNGQFRDLEDVLTEVGLAWDTLNKNQQANIAVAMAGTRQQSRFIAMMQDFERTQELVDISAESYGATLAQSADYLRGMEAAVNNLTVAWEKLITGLVDSELVIGVVNTLARLVEMVTWITQQGYLFIPILTLMGVYALNILTTKLAEYQINQQIQQQEKDKVIAQQQANVLEQQELVLAAKKNKISKQQLKDEAKKSLEKAKQKKTDIESLKLARTKELIEKGWSASEAQRLADTEFANQLREADLKIEQEQANYEAAKNEYRKADLEHNQQSLKLAQMQSQLSTTQLSQYGLMGNLINAILTPLQAVQSIMSVINALQSVFVALKDKEGEATDKNTKKTLAQAAAEKIKAAFGMASSASAIPVAGWVIAGAILAALVGITIAAAVATNKQSNAVENTSAALDDLQVKIYELGQQQSTIAKLSDEFEELSNKIVKSTEDAQRLDEIVQQLNDEGANITTSADRITQLNQIKQYEAKVARELQEARGETKDSFIEGYKEHGLAGYTDEEKKKYWELYYAADSGKLGYSAYVKQNQDLKLNSYLTQMTNTESGRASIRTMALSEVDGLAEIENQQLQDAILNAAIENFGSVASVGEDGNMVIDFSDFSNTIMQGLDKLETALDSGTIEEMSSAYNNLDEEQKILLKSGDPMFEFFDRFNEEGDTTAKTLTAWGYGLEDLNKLQSKLGTKGLDNYLNTMNEIEASDPTASTLEKQSKAFAELVALNEQQNEERKRMIETNSGEYKELVDTNQQAQDALDKAQTEYNDIMDDNKSTDKEKTDAANKLDQATVAANEAADAVDSFVTSANTPFDVSSILEMADALFDVNSKLEMTDQITALSSSVEQLSKSFDLANLSIAEQLELLNEYPSIANYFDQEVLTAADKRALLEEELEDSIQDAKDMMYVAKSVSASLVYDKDSETGEEHRVTTLTVGNNTIDMSRLWEDSEYGTNLRTILAGATAEEQDDLITQYMTQMGITNREDGRSAINALMGYAEDYNFGKITSTSLEESRISGLIDSSITAEINDLTSAWSQAQNTLNGYEEELSRLDKGSAKYNTVIEQRNQALLDSNSAALEDINKLDDKYREVLDETIAEGYKFSDFVDIVNGEAVIKNAELLNTLGDDAKDNFKLQWETYQEYAEKRAELDESIWENAETLAQYYIDKETEALEKQIEILEKRKEAYEDYFEFMDSQEEELAYEEDRESLLKQIQALSGGADAASKSKLKELQQQLNELDEAELERQKEEGRNALLNNLDTQIEDANAAMESLENSLWAVAHAIVDKNGAFTEEDAAKIFANEPHYAKGGLVTHTGPAWVDGTKTRPEAFLSANDTANIASLVEALETSRTFSTSFNNTVPDQGSNIQIDNIIIQTNELNNDQDWTTAGKLLAAEFEAEQTKRGITQNVNRRYRR